MTHGFWGIYLARFTSPSWFILISISILPLTEPKPPNSAKRKIYETEMHTEIDLQLLVWFLSNGQHQILKPITIFICMINNLLTINFSLKLVMHKIYEYYLWGYLTLTHLRMKLGKLCHFNIKKEMGCVKSIISIPFGKIYNHVSEPHCMAVLNILTIIWLLGEVPLPVKDSICFQFPRSPAWI